MSTPSRSLLAFAAILCLSSCKKVFDFEKDHPLEVASCCQVRTIDYADDLYYNVTYNAAGNPISYISQNFSPYGDVYLRYDRQGRLKDWMFTFSGTTFSDIWHRYFYPGPGLMGDSLLEYQGDFTQYPNPPYPAGGTISVTLYRLDREGRPVSYTYTGREGHTGSGTMEYDRAGNLVIPGVTYDNKVNPYQTNKIWQQVFLNYSRNNPYQAGISAYNDYGLPVEYLATPSLSVSAFGFPPNGYLIRLVYSCDSTRLAGSKGIK